MTASHLDHLTQAYLEPERGKVTVDVADLDAAFRRLARGRLHGTLTRNGRKLTATSAHSLHVKKLLKGLPKEVLDHYPGAGRVLEAFDRAVSLGDPEVKVSTADMGETLGLLYAYLPEGDARLVQGAEDAIKIVMPLLAPLDHEKMLVVTMSTGSKVQDVIQLAEGGASGASTSGVVILRLVLRSHNSTAFLLVHNHPSGDATPSRDDIKMTGLVKEAAQTVGLTFVDHIIVSRGKWTSLLSMGLL